MSKHTPGPWSVEDPMSFELSIVEANKETYEWKFIATIPLPDEDSKVGENEFPREACEANARLIAAAPDMLEALRSIASGLENTGSNPDEWMTRIMKREAWAIARDAIAKAEGR